MDVKFAQKYESKPQESVKVTEVTHFVLFLGGFVLYLKKEETFFCGTISHLTSLPVSSFSSSFHCLSFVSRLISIPLSLLPPGRALFLRPWSLHRLSPLWPPLFIIPSSLSPLSSCSPFICLLSYFLVSAVKVSFLLSFFMMHCLPSAHFYDQSNVRNYKWINIHQTRQYVKKACTFVEEILVFQYLDMGAFSNRLWLIRWCKISSLVSELSTSTADKVFSVVSCWIQVFSGDRSHSDSGSR